MFVKYEIFGLSIWFWIFIILLNGIIFGSFCSNLADKKGYSPGTWFAGGFFFGIIALIAIAGLPVKWEEFNNLKECPDCREMINIYANVCKYCGYRFTKEEQQEALQKVLSIFLCKFILLLSPSSFYRKVDFFALSLLD